METAYLPSCIFAAIAVVALVVTLVLTVRLILAKKEKRREMKRSKIAIVISALLVPTIAIMAVICFPIIHTYPTAKLSDMTGYQYEICEKYYSGLFEFVIQEERYSSEYPAGTIISQSPAGGSEYLIDKTTVYCIVSCGKEPDVTDGNE